MSSKVEVLNEQENTENALKVDPEFKIRPQSKQFIEKVMLNVVLLPFIMGYTVVYFNAIKFEDLMMILDISFDKALAQGFFTSCVPASACIGALLSRTFLKIFTRKQFFYIINLMCITAILLIQTKYMPLIIMGRLLQGSLVGIGTAIIPLYIKQFVPEMNGKYGLYNQLLYTFGIVWGFFFNLILHSIFEDPSIYWRCLFAFPLPLCLIQAYIVRFHYNFQTPRYLVSVNKNEQAKDLLKNIYKEEFLQEQFKVLYEAVHSKPYANNLTELEGSISQKDIKKEASIISNCSNRDNKLTQSIISQIPQEALNQQCKPKNNPLAVFCALHLAFQQQIIGIGVVIVYSGDIIKEIIPSLFYYYATIVHLIGICCVFLGLFLIKRYGRIILLQVGAAIISVCLLVMGVNFLLGENKSPGMIGIAVVILRATFSSTLGPIPWLYMAEIVNPNIIPFGTLINWTIATLVMFFYPILTEKLGGPGWIFIVNGILCIITMTVNSITLVETRKKNEIEIRQDFDKKIKQLRIVFPNKVFK